LFCCGHNKKFVIFEKYFPGSALCQFTIINIVRRAVLMAKKRQAASASKCALSLMINLASFRASCDFWVVWRAAGAWTKFSGKLMSLRAL